MYSRILIIVIIVAFTSCKKEAVSTVPAQENVDAIGEVKYSGTLMNGPFGTASGAVKIYEESGKYKLALLEVSISNGPDLHVYLSKEKQPVHFIDLGKLKSTGGTQVYSIAQPPDFLQYTYALIHCQQYNHLFGTATLMQ